MKKVGIIGTGMLGGSVASRLLKSGFDLFVYNRTREKTDPLRNLGAVVVDTPKEVASNSDIVITILKDAKAIEEVSFGNSGILEGNHGDLVVADMSTTDPILGIEIGKRFAKFGITMLDTPVMGGPPLAEKGKLVVMVGGDKKTFENYKEVFDCIGSRTFYLGRNGSGHTMKLAMNLQIAMLALSLSEGITLVRGSGLNPETFLEILNSTYFKTGMSEIKGPKMIKGEVNPTFALKMMKKDLDTINTTAGKLGLTLPMTRLANMLYNEAVEKGFGDIDYTGIIEFISKKSKK